ncbi:MAG: cysteine synthase family protein, partial [Deltaproteobacteria bacterium]|nr:cysteine synthase family protein [Deltaproteobacteria bacterium]
AIEKAEQILAETPGAWIPQQFENEANVEIHYKTTAQEIISDFGKSIDFLIAGVGTGGHITGVAEALKEQNPRIRVWAVEPEASAVLSGGQPSPHSLQGIGAGFVPKILKQKLLDDVVQVSKDEAFDFARRCAREEGIFVGISSGATLAALAKRLDQIPDGSTVMVFSYDTGERYLSVDGLFAV